MAMELEDLTCSVKDCNKKIYAKGFCRFHYDKARNYGNPLHKTKKDKNEIILHDDYAEIILQNLDDRALIDLCDVEKVKKHKWYKNSEGYVVAIINHKITRLHCFLLGHKNRNIIVDHKDRNKLNNRRFNLRNASQLENTQNRGMQSNNKSGVVGVIWHKRLKKWYAYITVNKKQIFLGTFDDLDAAKDCRVSAEKKYFGEFRSNANG